MTQTISKPKITANILGASSAVESAAQKILFVGQKTAAGSATSGVLQESVTEATINSLFGANSMLGQMMRAAKQESPKTRMDAIPLDDNGSGVAATGSFFFTGAATETSTLTVAIGSETNNSYDVSVTTADTADDVGTALAAAITADADAPFSAANSSGVVTITADNDGEEGNTIGFRVISTVAGISQALTAMNGGSNNPSLTGIFDVIDGVRYQTIVWPSTYTLATLTTELTARWPASNQILDTMAITTDTDTYANLVSTYNSENNQQLAVIGQKNLSNSDHTGPACLEIDTVISSIVAALRALRLTANESIVNITTAGANGALDSFGGDAIRSLPYFNTPLNNVSLVPTGVGFTQTEIEGLITAGVGTLGNNTAGNTLLLGDLPTTYKTDAAGNTDLSYKYANYVDTMSGVREYFFNNLKARYSQTRLTDGILIARHNMVNESVIRSTCIEFYKTISGPGYVLTQAGEDALIYFKNNLTVTTTLASGLVTITMKTPIVTQLREMVVSIQLSFTTP